MRLPANRPLRCIAGNFRGPFQAGVSGFGSVVSLLTAPGFRGDAIHFTPDDAQVLFETFQGLLPADWIAVHFDVRDHIFDSDLVGEKKIVNNLEAHLGLSIFF